MIIMKRNTVLLSNRKITKKAFITLAAWLNLKIEDHHFRGAGKGLLFAVGPGGLMHNGTCPSLIDGRKVPPNNLRVSVRCFEFDPENRNDRDDIINEFEGAGMYLMEDGINLDFLFDPQNEKHLELVTKWLATRSENGRLLRDQDSVHKWIQ